MSNFTLSFNFTHVFEFLQAAFNFVRERHPVFFRWFTRLSSQGKQGQNIELAKFDITWLYALSLSIELINYLICVVHFSNR